MQRIATTLSLFAFFTCACARPAPQASTTAPAATVSIKAGSAPDAGVTETPPSASASAPASSTAEDGGAASAAADTHAAEAEVLRGIREVSPTEHTITRAAVQRLTADDSKVLLRSARIVPVQTNGKMVGFKIFGIRPDSIGGKLGFLNGDHIERLQGEAVNDPEQLLQVWERARTAKVITVDIQRAGKPMKRTFRIVD